AGHSTVPRAGRRKKADPAFGRAPLARSRATCHAGHIPWDNTDRRCAEQALMKKQIPHDEPTSWLEQAYPQMHYLIQALDGDEQAPFWLQANSRGTALFSHALAGEKPALASLQNGAAEELDDLFEVIDNEDLSAWM